MLDTFIERWLGPLLIAAGVVGVGYGAHELMTLPEPTPLWEARRIIVGAPDPAAVPRIVLLAGIAAASSGWSLVRYFRRERDSIPGSA